MDSTRKDVLRKTAGPAITSLILFVVILTTAIKAYPTVLAIYLCIAITLGAMDLFSAICEYENYNNKDLTSSQRAIGEMSVMLFILTILVNCVSATLAGTHLFNLIF